MTTGTPETPPPDLGRYVKAPAGDAYVADCLAEATQLVADLIGSVEGVPDVIRRRAILETGAELYHRRQARLGVAQLGNEDTAPIRIARDPNLTARAILGAYLGPGLA
ncbi:MAG: hypothetical protein QM708_13535 [Propioniciclava sp.]|uniref:hypothetical protein n=1 Tax=Propioniciclava sp. TaxID=2038686 RepID=UPI0039E58283